MTLFKSRIKSINSEDILNRIIKIESRLGGKLFKTKDSKVEYHFFCFNESTWVLSKYDAKQSLTIIYKIKNDLILKQNSLSGDWQQLSQLELDNFKIAVDLYKKRVLNKLYPGQF